jgi:phospho-N-acetylmuramoyl-pentapeptide-transferase
MNIFCLGLENELFRVVTYFFVALIVSAGIAPVLIDLLYRLQFTVKHKLTKDKSNKKFYELHKHKIGTPNMGGILIWIVVPLLVWALIGLTSFTKTIIISFVVWGLIGFIDCLLVALNKDNLDFRKLQETFEWRMGKLALMYLVGVGIAYLMYSSGIVGLSFLSRWSVDLGVFPFILLIGGLIVFGVMSFEITDGLDGLLAGLTIRSLLAFMILLFAQGQFDAIAVIGIVLGVVFVYLYFNIPPARVFMGGPGAMPLGVLFIMLALYTDNLVPYFFMTAVMWLDMFSSVLQIFWMKVFKKRLFKIAPIHHYFEAIGWSEYKVTMRFWLIHFILCFVGIWVGLVNVY